MRVWYASITDEHRARIQKKNRDRYKKNARRYMLRKYRMTPVEWDVAFAAQGRCCAICKTTSPRGKGWNTDHDHATGKFRGILCNGCNTGIGSLGDSVEVLRAAAMYLKRSHRRR